MLTVVNQLCPQLFGHTRSADRISHDRYTSGSPRLHAAPGQINILSPRTAQMASRSHVRRVGPRLAEMAASEAEMQLYVCVRTERGAWWSAAVMNDRR